MGKLGTQEGKEKVVRVCRENSPPHSSKKKEGGGEEGKEDLY
jgi:hypothetical protein